MILILLNRLHVKLDRDVIFLAEAGEEGTSAVGIDYMVKEHWPEIEAEYALAEGGGIVEDNGKVVRRPDRHHGEGAAPHSPEGARPRRSRVAAHPAERAGPPGPGGGPRRHVGDSDAAQRDDSRLLREARRHRARGTGRALPRDSRSGPRG